MKWFTSDLHLSHKMQLVSTDPLQRGGARKFNDIVVHNETIMRNIYNAVKKGDDLYLLGDISWNKAVVETFFKNMPKGVRIHLIYGNHDKDKTLYEKYCTTVSHIKTTTIDGIKVVMCHYPMMTWEKSHFNSFHLFGHHHIGSHGTDQIGWRMRGKCINVNTEMHNYKPLSEKQIIEMMAKLPNNWDLLDHLKPNHPEVKMGLIEQSFHQEHGGYYKLDTSEALEAVMNARTAERFITGKK